MKLIDIDNQEMINLPEDAKAYLEKEYPEDEYPDMYDFQGDMCLDEREYNDMEHELSQKKLIGVYP